MTQDKREGPRSKKPKSSHPWKAWNPGQLKSKLTPTAERELVGISKPNRAR